MKRTVVLVILDGWGVGARDASNPIYAANPPTIARLEREFPMGALQASGIAVGLPWEEGGDSEVGHLTMGAGRMLLQHFPRISPAIKQSSSYENSAFPTEHPITPLGKVLADAGRVQLRIAETEKYAQVTYFFNGLIEPAFPGEYRVLIPSPHVARYDEAPAMSAGPITDRALLALNEGTYDFILINYANADMVARTGNFDATVQAITVIDRELSRLVAAVLDGDHVLLITSDHGNAEMLFDPLTGALETTRNRNPVPCYLVGREFQFKIPATDATPRPLVVPIGMLSDVAPTILALLGISKPPEMTGQSLLDQLVRTPAWPSRQVLA